MKLRSLSYFFPDDNVVAVTALAFGWQDSNIPVDYLDNLLKICNNKVLMFYSIITISNL